MAAKQAIQRSLRAPVGLVLAFASTADLVSLEVATAAASRVFSNYFFNGN